MVPETSVLVALVQLVDQVPVPPSPRRRGRPQVYADRLFLKALVIMIVRRLPKVDLLLAVLDEPTPEMQRLRALLPRTAATPPAAPGSGACGPCRPPCRPRSVVWGVIW